MRFNLIFCSLILATACTQPSRSPVIEVTPIGDVSLMERVSDSDRPYVLVNFFATYCKPCEQEIPGLVALAGEGDSHMSLMLVALDEKASLDQNLEAMFSRMDLSVPAFHYTLAEAEPFIRKLYPEWGGDIPLSLVFRNDGTLVRALGMTDPQEVTMVIHHDQSFRE